jgi:hypothetical protein
MPSDFPRSPKLLRGALAVYEEDTPGTQPQIIHFQYNPHSLRRRLEHRAEQAQPSNVGGAQEDTMRVIGPPVERIDLSIELDAADQLAEPSQNQTVAKHRLHPILATLEMLLYPPSFRVLENKRLAEGGEVQLSPAELPLTLFVWGESRVVPVRLTSLSVAEEAYDPNLNPIRAKVELGMQVLTYMELHQSSLGRSAYISFQEQKESLARQHRSSGDEGRVRTLLPGQ